jgi:hypothetical protein
MGVATCHQASADLFDDARKAIRTDTQQFDRSGLSVRGGVNLHTGQSGNTQTLLRGQASTGGGCGSFDFAASLKELFETMPDMFESVGKALLSNVPILVLCYSSPSLCDIYKHYQALINTIIQAKYASCQQMQNAMAYGGLRLRGGSISQCLEDEVAAGATLSASMDKCNNQLGTLRRPDGTRGVEVNLVKDALAAVGASEDTHALARNLLGEVTLQAGQGPLVSRSNHPQAAMLARYEGHKVEAESALRAAVDELAQTGSVSEATMQSVAVPGQPLPRAGLDALVALQGDPQRQDILMGKLSTGMALTRLTWDCHQIAEELAAAADGNANLTDEQRRLLEKKQETLQRNLMHTIQKIEITEKHLQPAVDELLREYTNVQNEAARAGIVAPMRTNTPQRYRTQQPMGNGR